MEHITTVIHERLGIHGGIKILQALLISAVIVIVNHFFFPKMGETSVLAMTVAFNAVHLSYKRTINRLTRKLVTCAVGCAIAFLATMLLPASSGQLWSYFLAIIVTCLITYLINGGRFDTFPLVVVTITYFAVAMAGGSTRLDMAMTTVSLFLEVLMGAAAAIIITWIIHFFPSAKIHETIESDPLHELRIKPFAFKSPRNLFKEIDPQFYMAILVVVIGGLLYYVFTRFFKLEYPWVLFDSLIIVSQASLTDTLDKSKTRIIGTLIGAAAGIIGVLLVGQLSFGYLFAPLLIALVTFIDYLVFKEYMNTTIVSAFLIFISATRQEAFFYMTDRVVSIVISIVIALGVYYLVENTIGKRLKKLIVTDHSSAIR